MHHSKVSVIGLGYIGLPTAAMFATYGHDVIGVDVNESAVNMINQGKIHIVEPDLDTAVRAAVIAGKLTATTTAQAADAFIVAVPTPFKENRQPDLSYIQAAAKTIAPVLASGNLVILESTSPVGATEKMSAWLKAERPDLTFPQDAGESADINIAHCPERVLPGHIMRELIENDRIIGGMTELCADKSVDLYKTFVRGKCIVTNARTAELAKLTENSFRDINIAFANELSMICGELDINVWELIRLANRHPRVNVLQPGCGVGGHCIAVDPWFIVDSAPETAKIIRKAREVNDFKPEWVVQQIAQFAKDKDTNTVICMGLAFKPDIDDLRESPAVGIVQNLNALGLKVLAVEPNISELPDKLSAAHCELIELNNMDTYPDLPKVLLVAHSQFKRWVVRKGTEQSSLLDYCGLTNSLLASLD
jgi:UDP-N-acetyl-D-mannosaminuronic acid dehydrogenase